MPLSSNTKKKGSSRSGSRKSKRVSATKDIQNYLHRGSFNDDIKDEDLIRFMLLTSSYQLPLNMIFDNKSKKIISKQYLCQYAQKNLQTVTKNPSLNRIVKFWLKCIELLSMGVIHITSIINLLTSLIFLIFLGYNGSIVLKEGETDYMKLSTDKVNTNLKHAYATLSAISNRLHLPNIFGENKVFGLYNDFGLYNKFSYFSHALLTPTLPGQGIPLAIKKGFEKIAKDIIKLIFVLTSLLFVQLASNKLQKVVHAVNTRSELNQVLVIAKEEEGRRSDFKSVPTALRSYLTDSQSFEDTASGLLSIDWKIPALCMFHVDGRPRKLLNGKADVEGILGAIQMYYPSGRHTIPDELMKTALSHTFPDKVYFHVKDTYTRQR